MTDLEAGRITAVMKVTPVAAWLAAKRPALRIVAQVPDDPQPLGIGFGKNEPALVAAVNRRLGRCFRTSAWSTSRTNGAFRVTICET
jgi:ABC-type amino acid transport substrate-binding protein